MLKATAHCFIKHGQPSGIENAEAMLQTTNNFVVTQGIERQDQVMNRWNTGICLPGSGGRHGTIRFLCIEPKYTISHKKNRRRIIPAPAIYLYTCSAD
jgi:hypothetical protein